LILHAGDSEGAIEVANTYLSNNNRSVLGWLDQAIEGNIDPVTKHIGFVKHGFTLAFHFLAYQFSYKESITQTLLMSGDTDTNACIVGGLIGANCGLTKLPCNSRNKILELSTQEMIDRPEKFKATNLLLSTALIDF
jgi:ADP-ribosylglycohydrolase